MNKLSSVEELETFRAQVIAEKERQARSGDIRILVNLGTCGIAAGALETLRALQEQIETARLKDVHLVSTGCIGLCSLEPVVQVIVGDKPAVTYGKVDVESARRILKEHVVHGLVVQDLVVEP